MFGNCRRCGRKLRSQTSREIGYGRICLWKIKRALPKTATRTQIDKAIDLINDGGLVLVTSNPAVWRNAVFRVVSSNGWETYLTAAMACSCPAGRAERLCYHQVAVAWVTA